ncbi:hypothetical protein D3C75_875990 [compost metagenome]
MSIPKRSDGVIHHNANLNSPLQRAQQRVRDPVARIIIKKQHDGQMNITTGLADLLQKHFQALRTVHIGVHPVIAGGLRSQCPKLAGIQHSDLSGKLFKQPRTEARQFRELPDLRNHTADFLAVCAGSTSLQHRGHQ